LEITMNRRPAKRNPSSTQSAAQQAVLNKLRSGGTIQGAQPNNPFVNITRFFDPRKTSIPDLKSGMVGGREALVAPGGWNQDTAGLGEITVGGQRFFPAQSGKDLVYQRAPGQIGGQYGSIRVPDQLASYSSVNDSAVNPADRAYQQEKARVTQMTEQDPMFKKYQVAELTKAYNTASPEEKNKIGLQIWAATNPELAQNLRPGQTGFSEAVTAFQSQSPLGAVTKAAGGMQYADLSQQPITTPVGPGGIPLGFSPTQLQTPLTGIEIPPTDKIGVKEFFSDTKPAPGAMEAFTDQMRLFSPEKLDETKRALLIQAFNKGLK
jgi:hypothetical protein